MCEHDAFFNVISYEDNFSLSFLLDIIVIIDLPRTLYMNDRLKY